MARIHTTLAILATCFAVLAFALGIATPAAGAQAYFDPVFGSLRTVDRIYGTGELLDGSFVNLSLDVFQPTNIGTPVPAKGPAIVMLHGGAFQGIAKNSLGLPTRAQMFATYGYTVFNINYRDGRQLANGGGNWIHDLAQDAKLAMSWVRDNASTYNVDPNRIGLGGFSDGATISKYAGYNETNQDVVPKVILDWIGASIYYPIVNDGPTAPPAFVVHGQVDNTLPLELAIDAVNQMNAAGIRNEFHIQQSVGHTVSWTQVTQGKTLLQHNLEFLFENLVNPLVVPEPASWIGLALGTVALCYVARRKRARPTV